MKITTWNVNGLRAIFGKDLVNSLDTLRSDVLCLQEIKATAQQVPPDQMALVDARYPHTLWNPAERPGYSGTATWLKHAPNGSQLGMNLPEFDNEGRIVATIHPQFWLFNVYFPNGSRDLSRVPYKLDFYARLLDLCDELHKKGQNVIICGDFNTAHQPIDLRHPKPNSTATGFLPEERVWIDHYLAHGFVDAFRRLYPEKVEYTWWTYIGNARAKNVGWRLDYFLVSEPLMSQVVDVVNHTEIMGSDHCPVSLILKD